MIVKQIPGISNVGLLLIMITQINLRAGGVCESSDLLTTKHLHVQTARLVERQDIESRAHDAGRLSLNELYYDLSRAHTLSRELWQRVLPRAVSYSIEPRGVQPVDSVCLVKQEESK